MHSGLFRYASSMPYSRISASFVDTVVLGEQLTFRHGKKANNRVMKSPLSEKMWSWNKNSANERGLPNQGIINLYSKWGNGGYGLIVTGNLAVDPKYIGEAGQGVLSLENTSDSSKAQFKELASAMKSDGALAVAQINHIGAGAITGYTNSLGEVHEIVDKVEDPLQFSKEQLEETILRRFAHAASVLYASGFDGMEVHSAHGMIFNQFLEPKNTREDEYGGTIENRARLLLNTYQAIRQQVPESTGFLVGVKLNSRDFQESGISREDIIRVCELIEETGFDFVELTGGAMESVIKEVSKRESTIARENFFLDFVQFTSRIFRKTVVYITGRWQTAGAMVSTVNMGLTQGVGLGRWSCSEPDFPKKLIAGEVFSCLDNKFAPSEFAEAKNAAHWQMKEMAGTKFDSTKGPCQGVTDFTVEAEALHFKKAFEDYKTELGPIGGQDRHAGVINYVPLTH